MAKKLLTGQGKEGKNGPHRKNFSTGMQQGAALGPQLFNIIRNNPKKKVVSERTRPLVYNYSEY